MSQLSPDGSCTSGWGCLTPRATTWPDREARTWSQDFSLERNPEWFGKGMRIARGDSAVGWRPHVEAGGHLPMALVLSKVV